MRLLTFYKAYNTIWFFTFFLIFGNWFFPFRHRPQKYTNNFGFKPSKFIEKIMKIKEFSEDI